MQKLPKKRHQKSNGVWISMQRCVTALFLNFVFFFLAKLPVEQATSLLFFRASYFLNRLLWRLHVEHEELHVEHEELDVEHEELHVEHEELHVEHEELHVEHEELRKIIADFRVYTEGVSNQRTSSFQKKAVIANAAERSEAICHAPAEHSSFAHARILNLPKGIEIGRAHV